MSLAPFAALEARANAAVFARLPNAAASIAGAQPVGVLFECEYELAAVGVVGLASVAPVVFAPVASVPADPVGLPIVVAGQAYAIAESRPDGAGAVLLILEAAP